MKFVALFVGALCLAAFLCPGAAAGPAPGWVQQRPDLEDAYWGIGQVAFTGSSPTAEEKQEAYTQAAGELSTMIGQRIVTSFANVKQETGQGPDARFVEETTSSISSYSRKSLSGVRVRDEWVDADSRRYHVWLVIGLDEANRQVEAWAAKEEEILREAVQVGIRGLEERLDRVEGRVDEQQVRMEAMESSLSALFTEVGAASDKIELLNGGEMNWSSKRLRAGGIGVPNPALPAGVRAASAERAARLDAKNNLIALVNDIEVSSTVLARDGELQSAEIVEKMRGRIRGARQVGETVFHQDGTAEVVLEVDVRDIFP